MLPRSPAQQVHPSSGRATWRHTPEKYLPPSLRLMSGENETCANAQWLVDRTTSDGSVYVLSLAGAQIANMELDIAPEELAYLN